MNLQGAFCAAGVVNEAQLSEAIHEEADARPGGADHLRQRLLVDVNPDRLWTAILAEVRQQQQKPGQTLLA